MKKSFYLLIFLFFFFGALVFAQEKGLEQINFPIPELGNCQSKAECEAYCDVSENIEPCLDFAEAHALFPQEEIQKMRKMLTLGETPGPGGCQGRVACEAYCEDVNHIEECITFAEKYDLLPPEELEAGKKMLAAIKKGVKPPPCNTEAECDIYCSVPEHMEECLIFGEAAGLIPPEELEEARMMLEAIKKGVKPPPCGSKAECDVYCSKPEHFKACVDFGEAAGFISPEEAVMIRKTGGKGPGGCQSEEECDAYCEDPAHMEECIDFSVKYGFMSKQEAEKIRRMIKTGFVGGPGGCKSEAECDAYCNELSHMEECVDFAVKNGFMSAEEAAQVKKMAEQGITAGPGGCQGQEECEAYCKEPAHMEECMEFGRRMGIVEPEQAERAKEMMLEGGPGGCKTKEECESYCKQPAHFEECLNFGIKQGFISPEEAEKMKQMPTPGVPEEMKPKEEIKPPDGEKMKPPNGMKPPDGTKPPQEK